MRRNRLLLLDFVKTGKVRFGGDENPYIDHIKWSMKYGQKTKINVFIA